MSKSVSVKIFLLFILLLCIYPSAKEEILDYDVLVEVAGDSSITVTENIKVKAEGKQIKRGIFREFPTEYSGVLRGRKTVPFEVLELKRDGAKESWHIKNKSNGKTIYIGKENVILDPGVYLYTIKYRTGRQMYFADEYDEIYWNITGQDWAFPIKKVRAVFTFPDSVSTADYLDIIVYTGRQGQEGTDYTQNIDRDGNIVVESTRTLHSGEGLSAKIHIPKGYIKRPTANQKMQYFLQDNKGVFVGIFGLIVLFTYYMITWYKYGIDPPKGSIIPVFESPNNFTPSECGYVLDMSFSPRFFTAEIIQLAIMGYLRLEEDDGDFTIYREKTDYTELAKHHKKIMQNLFSDSSSIFVSKSSARKFIAARGELIKVLEKKFNKVLFHKNTGLSAIGFILTGIIIIGSTYVANPSFAGPAVFLSIWLTIWNIGVFGLVSGAISAWKTVFRSGNQKAQAVTLTIFAIPFVIADLVVIGVLAYQVSLVMMPIYFLAGFLAVLFTHLLKAPTVYGRKIMDRIEGLKLYLSVGEKHWLARMNPPDKTPEEFEKMLPYAIALEVENQWGLKFASVLNESNNYRPGWYNSSNIAAFSSVAMTSSISGSLSSSISSSSTPASSGGSGGAGGGGGGGGGGGW